MSAYLRALIDLSKPKPQPAIFAEIDDYYAWKRAGQPKERPLATGGVLDEGRVRRVSETDAADAFHYAWGSPLVRDYVEPAIATAEEADIEPMTKEEVDQALRSMGWPYVDIEHYQ